MPSKKRYQPIQATAETGEKIKYLSKVMNKPKTTILAEIIDEIFSIGCEFPNGLELTFERSILTKTLTINFVGRCSLSCGQIPEAQLEALRKERFDEVKKDIAKNIKKLNKK